MNVVVQQPGLRRQEQRVQHPDQTDDDEGRAPSPQRTQPDHDGGGDRPAEITAEQVDAVSAADALLGDGGGQDGVIGRVIDRIRRPGEAIEHQ